MASMFLDVKTLFLGLSSAGLYGAMLLLMTPDSEPRALGILHHLGVLWIGILNFTVSFVLGFFWSWLSTRCAPRPGSALP